MEDNFLEKKAKGDQDPWMHCCRTGCVSTGTTDKRSLAADTAKSDLGFQRRDFLGLFKALVRGARTQAAEGRKQR